MATLDDIAREASVSKATVSRILAGGNKANWASTAERVRKIQQIAKRLGYRPNSAARATASGRFDTFALLLSTVDYRSYVPRSLFDGIHDGTQLCKRRLCVSKLPDQRLVDNRYIPRILEELCIDGLLINYNSEIPDRLIKLIHGYSLPSIWINSKQPFNCVRPDDFEAGKRVTDHLLSLGHRRVAFVHHWPGWHYSSVDRQKGYEAAMATWGLRPQVDSARHPDRFAAAREFLQREDRPTGVVAYGGDEAETLLIAAFSIGLQVPRDLSIVSLTLGAESSLLNLIGGIAVPEYAVGNAAVEMLLQKLVEPQVDLPARVLPFHPFVGTVAPPGNR